MKVYLFILTLFFCGMTFAQTTVSGSVSDSKNQPIPGANVKVAGESSSTVSDADGNFVLKTSKKAPLTLEVSSVGYASQKVSVQSNNQKVSVKLTDEETKLDEIVVSASRTPERVRESPVTIERMSIKDIKKSASPTFYDGLENLKEVQMNTSSMSFKSINTRGFATVANTRFMQLVDGMDNSSPLLNFVLGNLIGTSEIDVQTVELLPGASSALYGANAFNGILFINSQSPFTKQGISAYAKYGQTNQKAAGSNEYYDYGIRAAHAFNKYFAGKANFTYLRGTDWFATNYDDKNVKGRDRSYYGYDGVNVYGDEVATIVPRPGMPIDKVSRTGYKEVELTDNKVRNAKVDFSLHLRPFGNENFEMIWQSKFGYGNTVYQGANRYYLNDFFMQQHKLEFKGKNFFLRGYTTNEDGGKSYDMLFTGINISREAKADSNWFRDYTNAFLNSRTQLSATIPQAEAYARQFADYNISPAGLSTALVPYFDAANPNHAPRFVPGTPEFAAAFKKVTSDANVLKGSKLQDNSRIYHSDANYNFKDLLKIAEVQVGGSYRLYELNSGGRIYTDANSQINYTDVGAYTQVQKKLMDDRLKLTGSVRYDKSKNFDGNFSPRISAVYSAGANKQNNFRGSFQTGFRNPSTQDQYIGFNVGNAVLVGSAPDNLIRYTETLPVTSPLGQFLVGGTSTTINGTNAYYNSYTAASVQAFAALAPSNPIAASALLKKSNAALVKPETVKAFDLGYRGSMKGFSLDINGYYNIYNDFIGNLTVVAPLYGTAQDAPNPLLGPTDPGAQTVDAIGSGNTRAFQLYTNTNIEIKSIGFGAGVSRKIYKDFELGANYNYAQFDFDQSQDPSFEAGFNTPKHRVKASLGNEKLLKNLGFNVSARWNSEYQWQSTFIDGTIDAATVVDAQLNYGVPSMKSVFKVGATNIGGKEYSQVYGAGLIGQQYFVSWTITP